MHLRSSFLQCCCTLLLSFPLQTHAESAQSVKTYGTDKLTLQPLELTLHRDHIGRCNVVSLVNGQTHRLLTTLEDVVVVSRPLVKDPPGSLHTGLDASVKLQLIGHDSPHIWEKAKTICTEFPGEFVQADAVNQHVLSWQLNDNEEAFGSEVYPLEVSGPSSNRVDLTFFSDGYTLDEKKKFLADARRLALDMSRNQTFATVRPLVNFWAAFVPSRESGLGVGGVPKDTAFGLYRDGTELRAVYCSKKKAARSACLALGSQCDYPILLGNDPLYGGLGGEFTISTTSELNGALVLRHELGHSVIDVGEEYDGGFAYFGVNAAQNISQNKPFSWSHWLSPSSTTSTGFPRKERATMSFQSYPWTLLNKTSPWSATFDSSGLYDRFLVRFSLSGLPQKEDLKVHLDGKDMKWTPRPDIKLDRWHYDIYHGESLTSGSHELAFTLGESAKEGTAQLCSAEIIEFGNETEFNSTVGYYGAFPTFSDKNATTYRPTNEQCLMRIVTSPDFCNVCTEGLWMSLLQRVSLIDAFTITTSDSRTAIMDLALVPFGQVAGPDAGRPTGEVYTITWKRDGVEVPAFANKTQVTVASSGQGIWRADVQLHTREVRADPNKLLKQHAAVRITDSMDTELVLGGWTRSTIRFH